MSSGDRERRSKRLMEKEEQELAEKKRKTEEVERKRKLDEKRQQRDFIWKPPIIGPNDVVVNTRLNKIPLECDYPVKTEVKVEHDADNDFQPGFSGHGHSAIQEASSSAAGVDVDSSSKTCQLVTEKLMTVNFQSESLGASGSEIYSEDRPAELAVGTGEADDVVVKDELVKEELEQFMGNLKIVGCESLQKEGGAEVVDQEDLVAERIRELELKTERLQLENDHLKQKLAELEPLTKSTEQLDKNEDIGNAEPLETPELERDMDNRKLEYFPLYHVLLRMEAHSQDPTSSIPIPKYPVLTYNDLLSLRSTCKEWKTAVDGFMEQGYNRGSPMTFSISRNPWKDPVLNQLPSSINPVPSRSVQYSDPSGEIADSLDKATKLQLRNDFGKFLERFGTHIWHFTCDDFARSTDLSYDWYATFVAWLKLMPNLKTLSVSLQPMTLEEQGIRHFQYSEKSKAWEFRWCTTHWRGSYHLMGIQLDKLKEDIAKQGFPELKNLNTVYFRNCSPEFIEAVLYPNREGVKKVVCTMVKDLGSEMNWKLAMLPNLQEIDVPATWILKTDKPCNQLEDGCSVFAMSPPYPYPRPVLTVRTPGYVSYETHLTFNLTGPYPDPSLISICQRHLPGAETLIFKLYNWNGELTGTEEEKKRWNYFVGDLKSSTFWKVYLNLKKLIVMRTGCDYDWKGRISQDKMKWTICTADMVPREHRFDFGISILKMGGKQDLIVNF